MRRKFLGLDIENDALSAVLLESGLKGAWVTATARIALDPATRGQALGAALEAFTANVDVKGAVCAASLPAFRVSHRNIQVPFKSRKKIAQVLAFELEPMLPLPVDTLDIDFTLFKSVDPSESTGVLAAAVQHDDLVLYRQALSDAGIEAEIITSGGYATALCLCQQSNVPEQWMFADIGPRAGTLFIGCGKQLGMVRSFRLASDPGKRSHSLIMGIRQTWSAYENISEQQFTPQQIWVSSPLSGPLDPAQVMGEHLEVKALPVDLEALKIFPFKVAPDVEDPSIHSANALALALAARHGLRGINFAASAFDVSDLWTQHRSKILTTGVLALLVLLLMGAGLWLETRAQQRKLTRLDQHIEEVFRAALPEVANIVDPLQQMSAGLKKLEKSAQFAGEFGPKVRFIDALNDISAQLPEGIDVVITRLVLGTDNLLMDGETDNFNAVDDIKGRLEEIAYFKKVTITAANMNKTKTRVQFKLKVQLS